MSKAQSAVIHYGHSKEAWGGYENFLYRMLDEHHAREILEVGGGANPTVPLDRVNERGWNYSVLDIAQSELDKAPEGYNKLCADISAPGLPLNDQFDFVFSRMLAEHVRSGPLFHRNVYQLLKPGGVAFHFFPTLYTLPFFVNWLMPERLADWLLGLLNPSRDRYLLGKFPAYYSWCRGPTQRQFDRFKSLGYEVVEYHGYFGNGGYYERLPFMAALHDWRVSKLLTSPNPHFTSFAFLVLRKT